VIVFGWIGGILGLLSAVLVLWKILELGRVGQLLTSAEERLRVEAARESALRVKSELKFRLFVECATAAEEVTRTLVAWSGLLTAHATSVVFEPNPEGYRQNSRAQQEQLKAAQRAGLFLPPDLDPPLYRALKAFTQAMTAMASAQQKTDVAERRDICRPAVQAMEHELETFLNAVRVWKKRAFSEFSSADGVPADSVSDPPSQDSGRSQGSLPRATLPSFVGNGNGTGGGSTP
jgi:hypothetical protein